MTTFVGQSSLETQLVGGQQRTTTSKQQHSYITTPVAGSRQVMQAATVVLPFGKKEPDACETFVAITTPQGSIIFGGGKKTTAPAVPSQEIWISVLLGQTISGSQW